MTPAKKPEPMKGGLVRLKPDQMVKLKSLAKRWNWLDMELGSRLVDFVSDLDSESQQLLLGLPMKEDDRVAAAKRIADTLLGYRRDA
jgi:hypothetical protein